MLLAATIILAAVTLFGLVLVAAPRVTATWMPGAAHGTLGVIGFVVLLFALGGPRRGVEMGAGSFGIDAGVMFAAAIAAAAVLAGSRLRRRKPPLLAIGLHATFAIAGFTVLLVYLGYPA